MDLEGSIRNAEARSVAYADKWISDPIPNDAWGFFSYPDGPPALGGGQIATTWLESRDAALDFIAEVLPFHPPAYASEDVAERTRRVTALMKGGEVDDGAGVQQLNEHLKGLSQITFFGPLESLISGDDDFGRSVCADFLDLPEGQAVPAIPVERLAEFKDWLINHGI